MLIRSWLLLALLGVAAVGCSSDPRSTDGASTSALTSDIRATHCEIFVDRALPLTGSHALRKVHLYLKTLNDRLDGPIDKVGFYRQRTDQRCIGRPDCESSWGEDRVEAFVGSSDYFEVDLFIGGDYSPEYRYEGAFYVQTTKGTKYWANTEEGGNFVIDGNMYRNLQGDRRGPYYQSNPQVARVAADEFPYLNPDRCR
jgi:hypothetical protein